MEYISYGKNDRYMTRTLEEYAILSTQKWDLTVSSLCSIEHFYMLMNNSGLIMSHLHTDHIDGVRELCNAGF